MVDAGTWNDACRHRLEKFFVEDPRAVDAFTMLLFGATYGTGRDFLQRVIDLDWYLDQIDQRLAAGDMHESVRVALEKVKHPAFD